MKKILVLLTIMLFLGAPAAHAGNVDTYGIGAKATAMGGAFAAYADDPYAVYYNPAGLTQLIGMEKSIISAGVHLVEPDIEVENFQVSNTPNPLIAGPHDFNDESPLLVAPHIGYAMPLTDKLAFGIAAYAPWGLELEWDDDPAKNPGSYNYFHSYYIREAITPTLAFKITDKLSIGLGISIGKSLAGEERNIYISPDLGNDPVLGPQIKAGATQQAAQSIAEVQAANEAAGGLVPPITTTSGAYQFLNNYAPHMAEEAAAFKSYADKGLETPEQIGAAQLAKLNGVPATDHNAHVEGELEDDLNYSFNVGILYKPKETLTFGLTYRSRTDADFDGDLEKNGVDIANVSLDYDHPDQIQFGVRYVPESNPDLSIEFDLVWTNWSIGDEQLSPIEPAMQVEVMPGITTSVPESVHRRDWEDTKQIRIGVEWKANDMFTLRGGYFYDPTPIPDDTLDLMWPDADKKTYSLGCGIKLSDHWNIDAAFQYVDIEKARYIGGESENLNHSYEATGAHREVSLSADGWLWGAGMTVNYVF